MFPDRALDPDRPRDAVLAELALGRRDEARLPSKLPHSFDNHHLIGPGSGKIAGPYGRNIPGHHHDPPGAPLRVFINAMGSRSRSPARCRGPMCVVAAWDLNSSKIAHSCSNATWAEGARGRRIVVRTVEQNCCITLGRRPERSCRCRCLSCFGLTPRLPCCPA